MKYHATNEQSYESTQVETSAVELSLPTKQRQGRNAVKESQRSSLEFKPTQRRREGDTERETRLATVPPYAPISTAGRASRQEQQQQQLRRRRQHQQQQQQRDRTKAGKTLVETTTHTHPLSLSITQSISLCLTYLPTNTNSLTHSFPPSLSLSLSLGRRHVMEQLFTQYFSQLDNFKSLCLVIIKKTNFQNAILIFCTFCSS